MERIRGAEDRRRRTRTMAGGVLVLAAMLLASGCGWAQYRGGPEGTGYNRFEARIGVGNVAQLEPAWSRAVGWVEPQRFFQGYVGMDGLSPLARNGANLVVATPDGSIVLDAATGAERFPVQHQFPLNNDLSAAAVGDRIVLTGRGDFTPAGRVSVHDVATGAELWGSSGCHVNPSAPVVSGGRLFYASRSCVGTHSTSLVSVQLDNPNNAWSASTCCEPNFAPGVANGTVYFLQHQPPTELRLAALDAATGAKRWSVQPAATCPPTAPLVSGGRVYTRGATYDAATGNKLWDWPTCAATSVVTVTPETLYVPYRSATGASRLQAVNATTGAVRWSIPWNQNATELPSIPAAANGLLFAAGGNKLVARNASDGTVLWRSPGITGTFSEPIVADGMVYAMATDGAVHAYLLP